MEIIASGEYLPTLCGIVGLLMSVIAATGCVACYRRPRKERQKLLTKNMQGEPIGTEPNSMAVEMEAVNGRVKDFNELNDEKFTICEQAVTDKDNGTLHNDIEDQHGKEHIQENTDKDNQVKTDKTWIQMSNEIAVATSSDIVSPNLSPPQDTELQPLEQSISSVISPQFTESTSKPSVMSEDNLLHSATSTDQSLAIDNHTNMISESPNPSPTTPPVMCTTEDTFNSNLTLANNITLSSPAPDLPNNSTNGPYSVDAQLSTCVKFYLSYSSVMSSLSVKLVEVDRLRAVQTNYPCKVKVKLVPIRPETSLYTKSKEVKGAKAHFQETLTFKDVSWEDISRASIRISVYSITPENGSQFVGEVYVRCRRVALSAGKSYYLEQILKKRRLIRRQSTQENTDEKRKFACVEIVLQYDPSSSRLRVVVQKAVNLPQVDRFRKNQCYYIMVCLFNNNYLTPMQKSSVQIGTNPVWNHLCVFNGVSELSENSYVEITVMRSRKYQKDIAIGRVTIGPRGNSTETAQWSEMLQPRALGTTKWHEFEIIR